MSLRPERRRRRLPDDTDVARDSLAVRLASDGTTDTGSSAQAYAEAARDARNKPVHALFPLRGWGIALAIATCLLGVGVCLALHLAAVRLAPLLGAEAVVALGLDAPASIGRWLASTLLGLAAATSVFIYSLRRHRLDDYHGRYRMWILMALFCMTLSLAESTGLMSLVRAAMRLATDSTQVRFEIAWPVTIALLVALVAIRLALEIRRCGPALASLAVAGICFAVATSVHYAWPVAVDETVAPLWRRGSWLVGYVMVLGTFFLYGRRVQLDVAGASALPAKKKRKKPVSEKQVAATEEPVRRKPALKLRTDLDPVEATPPVKEVVEAPEDKPVAGSTETAQESKKRISKAERRRMARESRMAS